MQIEFGLWTRLATFNVSGVEVAPLQQAARILSDLPSSAGYSRGWVYPPMERPPFDDRPNAPLIPAQAYGLASTHRLTLHPPLDVDALADFVIGIIGFADGVRLTRSGWSHFYKAPIDLNSLSDASPNLREVVEVVRLSIELWAGADDELRTRLFGAVHWFQFSALFGHEFERFNGYYSVLDLLYWIHRHRTQSVSVPHAERAQHLGGYYGVPVPPWAIPSVNQSCRLAELRNELVHEARFAGNPTGFTIPTDYPAITYELGAFVNRLIYAVFGIPCAYSSTVATSRQMHGLDVMGPLRAV